MAFLLKENKIQQTLKIKRCLQIFYKNFCAIAMNKKEILSLKTISILKWLSNFILKPLIHKACLIWKFIDQNIRK